MPRTAFRLARTGITCVSLLASTAVALGEPSHEAGGSNKPAVGKKAAPAALARTKIRRNFAVGHEGGVNVIGALADPRSARSWYPWEPSFWNGWAPFEPATGLEEQDTALFERARLDIFALESPDAIPAATVLSSGTLTATTTTYNYSTAPWVLTAGDGPYPDLGGTATFAPILGLTAGTVAGAPTVTIDVSPTLGEIDFNTPIQYILAAGSGTSIVSPTSGLTLNSIATAQNITIAGSPISIAFGSQISSPISGGGSVGVTKSGSGNLYILGASTYTGGTHFNGGFTTIGGSAAVGDSVFGASGAGNDLSFNGGSVLFNTTGGLTTSRNIFIDTGGATLLSNTATVLNGVISGPGSLTNLGFGGTVLTLGGVNTYTGATISRGSNALFTLSGAGTNTATSSYDLMGTFTLTNTTTNVLDRVSDTVPITIRGLNFIDTGNATATSSETIGAVTVNNSFNTFLVTPGTTATNSLTLSSLTRANNATLTFRGTGLGGTPANTVSDIYVTTAPTLVGGGTSTGTTQSILPYAIGNTNTSAAFTSAGQYGSSFVTYGPNGIRPLATTEYATAFGVNNTDNVRLTGATSTAGSGVTANAVLFAPASAGSLSGGTINITSGAFLYSPTASATGTISAALNFGAAEGVITNTSLAIFSGILSGSNGLTLTAAYAPTNNYTPNLNITGANTFTGNTTINSGAVGFSGAVASGTPGAFGTSGTVILDGGKILASLAPTASTTFGLNISVIGNGGDYISPSTSGFTSTFNGNISLSNNLNLEGYTNAAASALIFNGIISGAGSITDVSYTYGVFNGNNTYSGGTVLGGATSVSSYFAGSDTAFGTGTIYFNGVSSIAGFGTAPRTLANPVFFNSTTDNIAGAAPLTFTGDVNLNGAATLSISNTAGTTFSGTVANGALTKSGGTGSLTLANPNGNTYTGGTLISAGTLLVTNTSGSGTGTGSVGVTTGATLGGTGFIVNTVPSGSTAVTTNVFSGGILQGGAGVASGALTLNGNLTLATGSIISLTLGGTDGSHSSLARSGGIWTFSGAQKFNFTGGANGTFYDNIISGLSADPGTENAWTFNNAGYTGTFVYDGSGDIDLNLTSVPEPATIMGGVVCVGLFGFGVRRRIVRQGAGSAI